MRLLLDTCVVSELRKPDGTPSVHQAIAATPEDHLFLSVITIGEIAKGAAKLNDGRRKTELRLWLDGLEHAYADRILGIDAETARVWGELIAAGFRRGRPLPAVDGLIAATAVRHGLTIATRNVRDFTHSGAQVFNPWDR